MNHLKQCSFILIVIFLFSIPCIGQKQNIFDSISENIRSVEYILRPNIVSLDKEVTEIVSTLNSNGSWSDINYTSTSQTSWNPGEHLQRLHTISTAYANKKSKFFKNTSILTKITQGLQYWYESDPRSTNWWYQQIYAPKQIGIILILLKIDPEHFPKKISQDLLNRIAQIGGTPDGKYSAGSSNRINIAAHWIFSSCLSEQNHNLDFAIKQALLTFKFNDPGGGLQPDYSFQEHGKQLYIGNYGYAFIDNLSDIALYLKGTSYAITPFQLELLSNFCRETYCNVIRGKYFSYSIPGRQLANKNELDRSKTIGILYKMMQLDIDNENEYKNALNRWTGKAEASENATPIHRHFYFSDYSFYQTPDYFFDVRLVSDRTLRTENINNENKKGYFLSDGAYNILIKGDEYFNIFPTWDWSHTPGTTTPHLDTLPDMTIGAEHYPGTSKFAGGLSDSTIGIATYSLDYPNFQIKGNKSWFIFKGEIVCLGSGIESNSTFPIHTTINQCNWNGKIRKATFNKNNFVLHNNIAYQIPANEKYNLTTKLQTGNWKTISDSQKDSIVSDSVFSLWLDHGIDPKNAKYQYTIIPNIQSKKALINFVTKNKTEIISNTEVVQAVNFGNVIQAVFFQKNSHLQYLDYNLTVDSPCLLMIQTLTNNKYKISISDPSQLQSNIHVTGNINDKKINWNLRLPENNLKGSTLSFIVE